MSIQEEMKFRILYVCLKESDYRISDVSVDENNLPCF